MKIIQLLFALIFTSSFHSQTFQKQSFDSKQDHYRHLLNHFPDSIPNYCQTLINSNLPEYNAYGFAALGYYYSLSAEPAKGEHYLKQAEKSLTEIRNPRNRTFVETIVANFQGSACKHLKNYVAATTYYTKGLMLARRTGDKTLEVRFVHNMADIQAALGELPEAIRQTRQGLILLERYKSGFSKDNYDSYKFNTLLTLGKYYNDWYNRDGKNANLDSAGYYYHEALLLTHPSSYNYYQCFLNIGGIHMLKKDYLRAIELFKVTEKYFSENNLLTERKKSVYNLAVAFYESDQYSQALYWFNESDRLYRNDSIDLKEYTHSNYFQSKIYYKLGQHNKAIRYYEIYLNKYKELLEVESDAKISINEQLSQQKFKAEMLRLQNEYDARNERNYWIRFLSVGSGSAFLFWVLQYKFRKFRKNVSGKTNPAQPSSQPATQHAQGSSSVADRLNAQTEQEILRNMQQLEHEQYFLSPEFTLHTVAKKIKTNTSYLSYVVNKYYGQSFSEYTHAQKISYVMRRMQTDAQYREYSTQAVAESVGYKNAVSFTKSFKRKTGMTPFQYAQSIVNGDNATQRG